MRRAIVTALGLFVLLAAAAAIARADQEPIRDNSFLIEEAYNQEKGVVQHIATWTRDDRSGAWVATFTQEWPLAGLRHQISYAVPFGTAFRGEPVRLGAIAINYRWQALGGTSGAPAFAPRLSLLVPAHAEFEGLDDGGVGVQTNLPLSVEVGSRWAFHANAGATWQSLEHSVLDFVPSQPRKVRHMTLGASAIWRTTERANLMLESTWDRADQLTHGTRISRDDTFLLSPGVRFAFDTPSGMQIVPGLAIPFGVGGSRGDHAVLLYMSVEHAF